MAFIYKITNTINDKTYIGKTISPINKRWREHCRDAKRFPNRSLYSALNKYGENAFVIEIIEECHSSEIEAKEQFYIDKFKSYINGYNETIGGEGKLKISKIEIESICEIFTKCNKNIKETSRLCKRDYRTVKRILEENNLLKNHIAAKPSSRKIACLDPYLEFDSIAECAKFLLECELTNNSRWRSVGENIARVANGLRGSYLGLRFKFI